MSKKQPHPSGAHRRTNAWENVQVRNGVLVGMLTDTLALDAVPRLGDGSPKSSTLTTVGNLGVVKVHKKTPSKFK